MGKNGKLANVMAKLAENGIDVAVYDTDTATEKMFHVEQSNGEYLFEFTNEHNATEFVRYRKLENGKSVRVAEHYTKDFLGIDRLVYAFFDRWNSDPKCYKYQNATPDERDEARGRVLEGLWICQSKYDLTACDNLYEGMSGYYGITTWREYWSAYNAFVKPFRRRRVWDECYDPEACPKSTVDPNTDIPRLEFEIFIEQCLGEYFPHYEMKYEWGYTNQKIAAELKTQGKKTSLRTVERNGEKIKQILIIALTEWRKA